MKQTKRRTVPLIASVLAVGLLIGLFTACPNNAAPSKPAEFTDPSIFKTNGHGTITGCTCGKEDLPKVLVIPAKIGEEVITTIGWSAFKDCTGLTNVQLPASLTTIGDSAFKDCTGLTGELKLPASLTEIGGSAFYGCASLTGELKLPASLTTIGNWAFSGCQGFRIIKH